MLYYLKPNGAALIYAGPDAEANGEQFSRIRKLCSLLTNDNENIQQYLSLICVFIYTYLSLSFSQMEAIVASSRR